MSTMPCSMHDLGPISPHECVLQQQGYQRNLPNEVLIRVLTVQPSRVQGLRVRRIYSILGVSYYNYSIIYPRNPILILKAP